MMRVIHAAYFYAECLLRWVLLCWVLLMPSVICAEFCHSSRVLLCLVWFMLNVLYAECCNAECCNAECCNAECSYARYHLCRPSFVLSVVMLSVIYAECCYVECHVCWVSSMLSVVNKLFMLCVLICWVLQISPLCCVLLGWMSLCWVLWHLKSQT